MVDPIVAEIRAAIAPKPDSPVRAWELHLSPVAFRELLIFIRDTDPAMYDRHVAQTERATFDGVPVFCAGAQGERIRVMWGVRILNVDYDTMPAGPELDRLVAEMVMGWKLRPDGMAYHGGATGWRVPHPGAVPPAQFSPSTNIANAWEVVERMAPRLRIQKGGHTPYYAIHRTELGYVAGYWTAVPFLTSPADTAPLAICRAALKAVR